MDDYGKLLMEWYIKGFNDELSGGTTIDSNDRLLMSAYNKGATHALAGDDASSLDSIPPNFSNIWNEAHKMHTEGEISEMQLRKIFRVLSGLRNQGEITL